MFVKIFEVLLIFCEKLAKLMQMKKMTANKHPG